MLTGAKCLRKELTTARHTESFDAVSYVNCPLKSVSYAGGLLSVYLLSPLNFSGREVSVSMKPCRCLPPNESAEGILS
jgi:hypothetical protein